ncbi:hypothetical protein AKJ50_02310 [candidate division MSBL1 archaeon SCGC-AAA382A13]|uniref:Uncharacterized protein n=1 Tax=candidate division MSBL1 archaeon SCGC-AAA382A13 TaxID=1698279 RepID=A0A133VDJ7_9EURY|nr:hypothetical protein AKJ50_02310 [candidate division MSBL1 archaeon SCGC-AAA382A13]
MGGEGKGPGEGQRDVPIPPSPFPPFSTYGREEKWENASPSASSGSVAWPPGARNRGHPVSLSSRFPCFPSFTVLICFSLNPLVMERGKTGSFACNDRPLDMLGTVKKDVQIWISTRG